MKKLTWHEAHANHPATLWWLLISLVRLRMRITPKQAKLLEE